ncbi:MAG: 7-cyano-7-deazaguanine synthase QueC [Phycisphaeraceae bacterium]|nr:7-cyano-7-deazaguanine synthase QueC [Phycisphaeraceae bacterium]
MMLESQTGREGRPAVVLLSGGLDSATVLAIARRAGYRLHALSFRYGQRHAFELDCAQRLAKWAGAVEHSVMEIDLRAFGGSALTDAIEVPHGRDQAQMSSGVPVTYVPARNTIFLSFALALAEVREACDIFIGVNAVDYSGYPDCRPEYIRAFEAMANLATRAATQDGRRVTIHVPLIDWAKARIIQEGTRLGVDYAMTHSCYDPDGEGAACGDCDACLLRLRGFQEADLKDPARYQGR